MPKSLMHGPGYLEIDHRNSPGLTRADVAHMPDALAVGAGERYETDLYICAHCQRQVYLQATHGRMSNRGYCGKCHANICNSCKAMLTATNECVPFKQLLEAAHNVLDKFATQDPEHPAVAAITAAPRIILTDA